MSDLPVLTVPETPETAPFWDGLRAGRILVPWCPACDRAVWYPRSRCPRCGSADPSWTPVSGDGVVYSRSVVRRGAPDAFAASAPYVVALVELDEGPRIYTNLVDVDPDAVGIGMRVRAIIDNGDDGAVALRFAPRNGAAHG